MTAGAPACCGGPACCAVLWGRALRALTAALLCCCVAASAGAAAAGGCRAPAPRRLTRPRGAAGGQEGGSGASAGEVAALVERLLVAKAPMLAEYLSLGAAARLWPGPAWATLARGAAAELAHARAPSGLARRRRSVSDGRPGRLRLAQGMEQSCDRVAPVEPVLDCLSVVN